MPAYPGEGARWLWRSEVARSFPTPIPIVHASAATADPSRPLDLHNFATGQIKSRRICLHLQFHRHRVRASTSRELTRNI